MINIQLGTKEHVDGIVIMCTEAFRLTSRGLLASESIDRRCKEFFNKARVLKEVTERNWNWGGYIVAVENGHVIGAGGGGMTGEGIGEVFVLYLDPNRRNEGIGSRILKAITEQQKVLGATEQWVSVQKDNQKGIPFYEAKGFLFQQEVHSYESQKAERAVSLRYKRMI
ncbi:GNAT family N-acetyltransferase [Shouchella patagoniensis]|uniref:GNAT family N-acetyltransferase n=1 Tax=Shouchella patagoniensis TaxID=228576 RepID=UPI000994C2A2|nr:GNAT family N-acetyltransferase [Shouchella patagoniensis]